MISMLEEPISKYIFRWDFVPSHQSLSYRIIWQQIWSIVLAHIYVYSYLCICRPGFLCIVSGALILKFRFNIIFCSIDILPFSWRQVYIKWYTEIAGWVDGERHWLFILSYWIYENYYCLITLQVEIIHRI